MRRSFPLLLAAVVALAAVGRAETPAIPQVEQTRQFPTGGAVPFTNPHTRPAPAASSTTGADDDADAFGTQAFLKRPEKAQPFSAFAEIGAFVTNNVALTRTDRQDDRFLVGTVGAAFSRRLTPMLRVDAGARLAAYRYDRFTELDFQSLDLSLAASWSPPLLHGAEVQVRYTFTHLTTARRAEEFFHNHAVLLGVQKVIPFNRAQAVYFGVSAQWSRAEPEPAGRDEYSAYAGYRAQLTRRLDADLFYRYARHVYREGAGREDDNQTASLTLRYHPTAWLSLSATGFYGRNRSNRRAFDYEAANAGVGLQCSVRF